MPFGDDYNPPIRWIHISDLHMTAQGVDNFNIKNILPKLIEDIVSFSPHFIIFSGDISFSGKKDEYLAVNKHLLINLLQSRNLTSEKIFLVPGNHDVDRDILIKLPKDILSEFKSQNEITDFFQSPEKLNLLMAAHSEYYSFSEKYGKDTITNHLSICKNNTFNLKNKRISVVSLSTSILSNMNLSQKKGEGDYGQLAIGEYQLNPTLPNNKPVNDLNIVITHHPLSYLSYWDRKVIENVFSNYFHFHFFGHSHYPKFEYSVSPSGKLVSIQTGALFSDYHDENMYTQLTWILNTNMVNVKERKWDKTKMEWITSNEAFEVSLDKKDSTSSTVQSLSLNINDYNIKQSKDFISNLKLLNINFDKILSMVQKIFENHINYFRSDYDKIPIPLDPEFYILISKLNQSIELHRIISCKVVDSNKLLDWNKIIFLYRKLTYFSFRKSIHKTEISHKEFNTANKGQKELGEAIIDYFKKFELITLLHTQIEESEILNLIQFHLKNSIQELEQAYYYFRNRRNFSPFDANAQIITHLEASLMSLHKIISSYFPGDKLLLSI